MTDEYETDGYDARPWWYWLLIYVVAGGLIYALIYLLWRPGSY